MDLKNAGIYVRVSTERQVQEGYSISAQKENLTNFAKSHNFKVYDVYADEGISGKNIEGRPDVKRLIKDIKNGKIDVVLLQRFDRLTRSISDTQEFIDLFKEFNVDVWSISDGGIVDITSSNGRFMALLKGLFGQHERELTAERIKDAFGRKAREGYTLCCGCTPYGYRREKGNKVIIIKQDEAKVVRRIYKMYIEGTPFNTIAKILTAEGIPTKRSGQRINIKHDINVVNTKTFVGVWSSKLIKLILTNPVYIGKVRYGIGRKDYYIGDGHHKPIITEKMWNKVQEKISKIEIKTRTNRPKDDVYFCGTLICGVCGKKLTTSRTIGRLRKDGTRNLFNAYRCVNQEKQICNARYVSHKKVEEAFIEYLKNNIAEFDNIEDIIVDKEDTDLEEMNDIKKLLSIKRIKQKEVMNLFISEKIDYNQFKYMSEELDSLIKINETRLSHLKQDYINKLDVNKIEISRNIVDHWKVLTDKEKFNFLNEFVESITMVNRDTDRHNGKAEILEVKFYDVNLF